MENFSFCAAVYRRLFRTAERLKPLIIFAKTLHHRFLTGFYVHLCLKEGIVSQSFNVYDGHDIQDL